MIMLKTNVLIAAATVVLAVFITALLIVDTLGF
jgi:hypothetical protein